MDIYWLCPLYSFSCDSTNTQIGSFINIISAPIEFKNWMQEQYPTSLFSYKNEPTDFQWVLKISPYQKTTKQYEEYVTNTLGVAHWYMYVIIWAFRLHKRGYITPGVAHCFKKDNSKLQLLSSFENTLCKNGFNKQPFYKFIKKDQIHVNDLFSILQTCFRKGLPTPFRIAFERFNSSYYENAEDALIDQMIAFESLLLDDDKELGYKLALRTAFLISKNRGRVFNDMKNAYNLRSQIVHGKKRINEVELLNILPVTEKYLRKLIVTFITLIAKGKTISEIRNMLDTNILNNNRIIKKEMTF